MAHTLKRKYQFLNQYYQLLALENSIRARATEKEMPSIGIKNN